MIRPDKLNNALYALQGVLIQARRMAYEEASHKEIARLLDYAEELPRFIAAAEDKTEVFRQSLTEITTRYNSYFALQRFDESPAPEKW